MYLQFLPFKVFETSIIISRLHGQSSMAPWVDRCWTARRIEYKEVRIGLAMKNHSSEESGDCESVQNPLGEDSIMKGPQLTKQQPWLHGALSVAGLIVALCLLIQTRSYPAWEFLFCGNQTQVVSASFYYTQIRPVEWAKDKLELGRGPGLGTGHHCSVHDLAT